MKIVVVDYQLGNIESIINMLRRMGIDAICSGVISDIQKADKLILPGVGAFDYGMKNLQEAGLIPILNEEVFVKKKPLLGICLGMQLLLNESEEGLLKGLGWIKGKCVRFALSANDHHLKVPHMGWNRVTPTENKTSLLTGSDITARYYFVHSYHAICQYEANVVATACHGYSFPAIIQREQIFGVQFHPEKSHKYGMEFLKKFVEFGQG